MDPRQQQQRRRSAPHPRHSATWWLGRWPVLVHRSGLGRLLGDQYVIVVHRGRRSGRLHETAVMRLRRDLQTGEITLVAGRRNADWYRNIRTSAPVAVLVGHRRFDPHPRFLGADEVAEALDWSRANRPRNARIQAMFFGWPWPADPDQIHALASSLGGVAFRPATPQAPAASDAGPVTRRLRQLGLAGPAEYAFQILHGLRQPRLLASGATAGEEQRSLPGDDVVPDAMVITTRAHTINAPPERVWPWVAWLGGGRGGWPGWYPFARPHDPSPIELGADAGEIHAGDVLLEVPGPESPARWRVASVEAGAHPRAAQPPHPRHR